MRITALDVRDVRCIATAAFEPAPGINLVVGDNAAGKTSLLESIHLLGTGRSFAASRPSRMVRTGSGPLRVVARVQEEHPPQRLHRLGLERAATGPATMRLDGETVDRIAVLARMLPVVAVHPDSHELVSGGPGTRRRLLDQGLFHVEPSFHATWQRYRRCLAQRNALLRSTSGTGSELTAWESELAEAGRHLDRLRRAYVDELGQVIDRRAPNLMGTKETLTLDYRQGWPESAELLESLRKSRERDREHAVTSVGPHRADLVLRWNGRNSRQRVSRGQQKLLVYLLRLAQAEQLAGTTGEPCILLLDDLAAELDGERRAGVLAHAADIGAQVFITALEIGMLPLPSMEGVSVFHVEQGRVREVVQ